MTNDNAQSELSTIATAELVSTTGGQAPTFNATEADALKRTFDSAFGFGANDPGRSVARRDSKDPTRFTVELPRMDKNGGGFIHNGPSVNPNSTRTTLGS